MSEFEGFVQMDVYSARDLSQETLYSIQRKRKEYLEKAIQYWMDQPAKVRKSFFGKDKIIKEKFSREGAIEKMKVAEHLMFGSQYDSIMSYWNETETECNNILSASRRKGVECMYIPIKTIAFFEKFNKL